MSARRLPSWSVACLAAAIALAGCSLLRSTRPAESPSHAPYMLVTAAVGGEVADCGCKNGPKGGLARRKTLIDTLSANVGEPFVLDAGDFLGTPGRQLNRERAAFVIEAMGALGYGLATFGEVELSYGWPFLRSLAAEHGLRFVCANVFDPGTGELLAPQYVIHTLGEHRVAFFGMLAPDLAITPSSADTAPAPEVRDPIAIGMELVPRLRREADLVVGLLHMKSNAAKEFARKVGGLDLVVVGHDPSRRQKLEVIEGTKTPSMSVGHRGRYIGMVQIQRDSEGETKLDGRLWPLDTSIPSDPILAAMVAEHEAALLGGQ